MADTSLCTAGATAAGASGEMGRRGGQIRWGRTAVLVSRDKQANRYTETHVRYMETDRHMRYVPAGKSCVGCERLSDGGGDCCCCCSCSSRSLTHSLTRSSLEEKGRRSRERGKTEPTVNQGVDLAACLSPPGTQSGVRIARSLHARSCDSTPSATAVGRRGSLLQEYFLKSSQTRETDSVTGLCSLAHSLAERTSDSHSLT